MCQISDCALEFTKQDRQKKEENEKKGKKGKTNKNSTKLAPH